MMKNHLIKEIEIRDFKCFTSFKAGGFSRVNLIGGKNNVGKTAFMEACYINSASIDLGTFVFTLYDIKFRREYLNLQSNGPKDNSLKFIEQSNNIYVKTNINTISFRTNEKEGVKKYRFEYAYEPIINVNVNEFSFETNVPASTEFIDIYGLTDSDIKRNFSAVQKKDDEKYINETLKEFDPNIGIFKIIDGIPQCKTNGDYLPITEFGDGVRHLISLLTSCYHTENGHLFIDEIDNGIHYTMLDKIWKLIFTLSKKLNVQVFATTHSKECIESFNRVQLKLDDINSSYFELAKKEKTHEIFMRGIDSNQLEYELSHKGRYRGE